jgi:GDPmannose 4,6-dehydratase
MESAVGPQKVAVIIGVTGQDGSYLSELLLAKNYKVVGVSRRASTITTGRINHLMENPDFEYVEGDITDFASMERAIDEYGPDEVYNLAAQSHVHTSFTQPMHTWDVDAKGVLNLLEIMRSHPNARFYQASTSEMFGKNIDENGYQSENTIFMPQSPYAISKVAAHHLVRLYRDSYNLHASAGILFNHEGPRRGEFFVTRKITKYVAQLEVKGVDGPLRLGNLNAHRDWGDAEDYVEAMYLMLQQDDPSDYVIATGETHTVRDFVREAFGCIKLDYAQHVVVDPKFYRPAEVEYLRGDATKARENLGWQPKTSFRDLVHKMVQHDIGLILGLEKAHGKIYDS